MPQCERALFTLVSQPAVPGLQSPHPGSQLVIVQTPAVHANPATLGPAVQTVVQEPQWEVSLLTSISHPLPGIPSQSANPVEQAKLQSPA